MQNNKKIMDDYLVITVVILIILFLLCYFTGNHQIISPNVSNTGDTLIKKELTSFDTAPNYAPQQYEGETLILSNGQSVCDFQRFMITAYPNNRNTNNLTPKEEYEKESLPKQLCNPLIKY